MSIPHTKQLYDFRILAEILIQRYHIIVFSVSLFVVSKSKKVIQAQLNNMRLIKLQNFHFWMNCPFKQ